MRGPFKTVKELKGEDIVWLLTKVFRFTGRINMWNCYESVSEKVWKDS